MAWTNVGFDGTINEAQWSQMSTLMGSSGGGYLAAGNGDCLVTAVPGARSVSVAAGSLYGDGIVSTNSAPEVVAMTTPVNGQWYVIALRRTWATNTAALVAIAGATTTTTTPTAPPTSFPTLNTNQGVLTDQPIAWAWCNSANTTVVVYDIRLKGIKSTPPVVANANERDAKFMTPTQGLQVWRDDLGAVETYFGLYNASTNPGGRDAAGWYTTDRSGGLVPLRPTTVTVVSGTATVTSLGQVNFTNATKLSLDGLLVPGTFKAYKFILHVAGSTAADIYFQYRQSGTDITAGNYYFQQMVSSGSSASFGETRGAGVVQIGNMPGTRVDTIWGELLTPNNGGVSANRIFAIQNKFDGGGYITNRQSTGVLDGAFTGITGFTIQPTSGNFSGWIEVFAYNQ